MLAILFLLLDELLLELQVGGLSHILMTSDAA